MKKSLIMILLVLLLIVLTTNFGLAESILAFGDVQLGIDSNEVLKIYGFSHPNRNGNLLNYYTTADEANLADLGIACNKDGASYHFYVLLGEESQYMGKTIPHSYDGLKRLDICCYGYEGGLTENKATEWFENTKNRFNDMFGDAKLLGLKPPKGVTTKGLYEKLRAMEGTKENLCSPSSSKPLDIVRFAQWEIEATDEVMLVDLVIMYDPDGYYLAYIYIEGLNSEEFNLCVEVAEYYQLMLE